jgi:putative Mg2+ transporter-C (MgtC) family protein
LDFLQFVDAESGLKLLLATACGAVIGLEREIRGRPAGLRTNALVCLASCLLIVISRTGALVGLEGPDNFILNVDPARMGAGIVTGIGFLGAGAILRIRESLVRGLTTAASIWFVAAIGISVGMGAYVLAAGSTLMALLILTLLNALERRLSAPVYRTLRLTVANGDRAETEQRCRDLLKTKRMRVHQVTYRIDNDASSTVLAFSLRTDQELDTAELVSEVAGYGGVTTVDWS